MVDKQEFTKLIFNFLEVNHKIIHGTEEQKDLETYRITYEKFTDKIDELALAELKIYKSEIKNLKCFQGIPIDHFGDHHSNHLKATIKHKINILEEIQKDDSIVGKDVFINNKDKFRILNYLGVIKHLENNMGLSINRIADLLDKLGMLEKKALSSNQSSLNKVFTSRDAVLEAKQSESVVSFLNNIGINLSE